MFFDLFTTLLKFLIWTDFISIFSSIWSKSPICGNEIHYAWDGVCRSSEACMCNKGLNEAFGEKLFNFILFSFGYLVIYHPNPLRSHAFCGNAIHYAWDGVCRSREACMCNKGLNEALERSYSTLYCSVSDIWSFIIPPPCVHMHLWQCNPLCLRWGL